MTRLIVALMLIGMAGSQAAVGPALAASPPSGTPALHGAAAKMDSLLRTLTAKGQFQGTVLVARKGTVLLQKGYGVANMQSSTKNQVGTQFSIGSITKQFTAMAILQLQERGKLSVQNPICGYLSSCPAEWKPITLHMLLTHTSGIPDFPTRGTELSKPMSIDQIIERLQKEPLDFTPGERWSYSNSGYDLLGYVVQKVSGQPWSTFVQQNILNPLGMKHTGFEGIGTAPASHAVGYGTILGTTPMPTSRIDPSLFYSAGQLYSTVGDLYTWDRALSTQKLASRKSLDAMFTPYVALSTDSSASYGYGWLLASLGSHRLEFHDGSVPGFESLNLMAPDDGLTVIVLSNDGTADSSDIGIALTEIAFGLNPGLAAA